MLWYNGVLVSGGMSYFIAIVQSLVVNFMEYINIQVGDIVRFKKKHACGGQEWRIVRTGADIGLVCQTCQRRIMMPRDKFRRLVKTFVPQPSDAASSD